MRDRRTSAIAVAVTCLVAITVADGPRTALLAALAAGAILTTRIRFSVYCAAGVLTLAALLVLTGPAVGA